MVEPLEVSVEEISEEDYRVLSDEAFKDGPEGFLRGQVELMALYGIGLYDSSFRAELDRQIADFYSSKN